MSMYVDILSSAMDTDEWINGLSGSALIAYVLACREEMIGIGPLNGHTAYSSLAADVAYDRALIKLCEMNGVIVTASDFVFPAQERNRLEHELANAGINLAAQTRRRQGISAEAPPSRRP